MNKNIPDIGTIILVYSKHICECIYISLYGWEKIMPVYRISLIPVRLNPLFAHYNYRHSTTRKILCMKGGDNE
jgi:hypothetical protein